MTNIITIAAHYHQPESLSFPQDLRFNEEVMSAAIALLSETKKKELSRFGWEEMTSPSRGAYWNSAEWYPDGARLVKRSGTLTVRIILGSNEEDSAD